VGVGANQVEVELVGGDLGEEVGTAGEGLQVEELVFLQAVDGFDVAVIGVSGGRDAHMLAVAEGGGEAGAVTVPVVCADELTAVVGLPDQIAQLDPVAVKVTLDTGSEDDTGSRRAALSKGPEQQPTADFTSGVLDHGQTQPLGLGPVVWDIIEIFGVGGDLLEQPPAGFQMGQVLLALILPPARVDQSVLAPDALDGHMTGTQVELALQPSGPEGGQLAAQDQHLLLEGLGRLVRAVMGLAALLPQPRRPLLLEASQPLAHSGYSGGEGPGGRLDALLARVLHQP
jgi:hypothetical protein